MGIPLRLTAAAVAVTAAAFVAVPSAGAARPDQLGIATTGGLELLTLRPAELAREFDGYRNAGARWVRFDFNWNVIQNRGRRHWNWAPYDALVGAARARGLMVLGTIDYAPRWARRGASLSRPPRNMRAYARFAGRVARRYGPMGVHHWEIWNEPNVAAFWSPRPSVRGYVRMLRRASIAIKRANPGAVVITGGLAPAANTRTSLAPRTFVRRMYRYGARRYFDAIGHHASAFPYFPSVRERWNPWFQMHGTRVSLRSLMVRNGDAHKQIWVTEYGAPTATSRAVSEVAQANMVTEAYNLIAQYPWAGPLFWYSYRDRVPNPQWWMDACGLVRYDHSPKPAFLAYRALAGL
jgi:polysaccharide biosynthesis protein PslG